MKTDVRLLMVDSSTVIHRACYAASQLHSSDGTFTGGLFSFINQVTTGILKTASTAAVLVFDSKPYLKARELQNTSTYKGDRKPDAEEHAKKVAETKRLVTAWATALDFPVLSKPGAECDDIMARVCSARSKQSGSTVLMTGDTDLYQCLAYENVSQYRGGKHAQNYTRSDFVSEFAIPPEQWVDVIAAAGSHNGVPGVRRLLGVKTAIKNLQKHGKPKNWLTPSEWEQFTRNKRIACLPYRGLKFKPSDIQITPFRYTRRLLVQQLARYEIQLTKQMDEAFSQIASSSV